MTAVVCGISFGSSNLVVAVGPAVTAYHLAAVPPPDAVTGCPLPNVAANDDGDRVTPIAVQLPDAMDLLAASKSTAAAWDSLLAGLNVGAIAKTAAIRNPKQVANVIVPLLGDHAAHGLKQHKIAFPCEMEASAAAAAASDGNSPTEAAAGGDAVVVLDGTTDEGADVNAKLPVADLCYAVLRKALQHCESAAGGLRIVAVTFALPREVDHSAFESIARRVFCGGSAPASKSTGSGATPDPLIRVIPDDTAAVLWSLTSQQRARGAGAADVLARRSVSHELPLAVTPPHLAMVVDLGAYTATASVFEVRGGGTAVSNLSSVSRVTPVGALIDRRLAQELAMQFQRKRKGVNVMDEARPFRKLVAAAEKLKCTLSTTTTGNAEVEAILDGADLNETVSRAKLDGLIDELGLAALIETIVKDAMSDALSQVVEGNLPLLRVVLVGGTGRIPKIQAVVQAIVRRAPWRGVDGDSTFQAPNVDVGSPPAPDEFAALGAAAHAQTV